MINQKINALKFVSALVDLHRTDDNNPRMSLLDAQVLLLINEHKELGKNDMLELMNKFTISKSFIDRPVSRLIQYGLIDMLEHEGVSTLKGEARRTYIINCAGNKFLKECVL